MNKLISKSNVLAIMYAVVAIVAGLLFYKTTAGTTNLIAGTCGFLTSLFVTVCEFVYLKVIREVKHEYILSEVIGALIGAIILIIVL